MSRPDRAAADLLPDATAQSELDDSWAAIGKGEEEETAAGLDAAVAAEQQTLAAPVLAKLVDIAHAACGAGGSPASVGRLLLRAPGNTTALADAQLCASPLSVQVTGPTGVAGDSAALGPGDKADNPVTSASLRAVEGDSLQLTGPIAALRCVDLAEDPETIEADQLVLKAAGVEVARLSPASGQFLANPLKITVHDLFVAAGLDPARALKVDVTLWRESAGCGGLYGAAPVKLPLFSLTLDRGTCTPSGSDPFCVTPVRVTGPPTSIPISRPIGFNNRGEVLLTFADVQNNNGCNQPVNGEINSTPCAVIWKAGAVRLLPARFEPLGLSDDGTVGGNLLEGLGTLPTPSFGSPAIVAAGSSEVTRLASSMAGDSLTVGAKELISISAEGRAIYVWVLYGYSKTDLGFCKVENAYGYRCRKDRFFASKGPAWGPGTQLIADQTENIFDIQHDGDAAGIVGDVFSFSNSFVGTAMKDFQKETSPGIYRAIDAQGDILFQPNDASSLWGLLPASADLPQGFEPRALGRQGDVVACSAPDGAGLRQMVAFNLHSHTASPRFSSQLSGTWNGVAIDVHAGNFCSHTEMVRWLDDKGRLLAAASSATDPSIRAVILTPRGVPLP